MNIQLVDRIEELKALAPRWDELAHSDSRDGFFRTFGWYSSWMRHVRPEARPFVLVAREADGTVVGLAPLCRAAHKDRWLPIDAVSLAGREVVSGDFLDCLAVPEKREQVLAATLDYLWELRSRWGLLLLGEVIESGDTHRAVEALARRRGLPFRVQEERVCPCIELPTTFDEYLGTFSPKRRHELRRQMRVLIEKSGAQVDVYSEAGDIQANLGLLIQLHAGRWQRAKQSGNMGRPGFAQFLNDVSTAPPAGSRARLYVMRHNQQAVAALLIFYCGESALLYSMGWNPESEVAQLSPGIVLVAWSIRDAVENGIRYYDFLRGDEKYKSHLARSSRKTVTLLVGRSLSARAYLGALQLKDAFKQRYPEWWDRNASAGRHLAGPAKPAPANPGALQGEGGVTG